MNYRMVLIENEEGFAVGCPALPGCWSQGANREEALASIRDAIRKDIRREAETAGDHFSRDW